MGTQYSHTITVHVTDEIRTLIAEQCKRLHVGTVDVVRDALAQYFFNQSQRDGYEMAFIAAQRRLPHVVKAIIHQGLTEMPKDDFHAAVLWAEEILGTKCPG